MGETPEPQRIEITFSPDVAAAFASAVVDMIDRITATPPPADAAPAITPFDLGLVPWAFHDPQQNCEVVSYLDDRNQVRHVPTTRMTEVPKKWRRLWVASS
jgi:hypothetical protein